MFPDFIDVWACRPSAEAMRAVGADIDRVDGRRRRVFWAAGRGLSVTGMIVERKLVALRKRLIEAQRGLILHAAESETVPTSSALRQIADLESAIVATETMIEEQRTQAN